MKLNKLLFTSVTTLSISIFGTGALAHASEQSASNTQNNNTSQQLMNQEQKQTLEQRSQSKEQNQQPNNQYSKTKFQNQHLIDQNKQSNEQNPQSKEQEQEQVNNQKQQSQTKDLETKNNNQYKNIKEQQQSLKQVQQSKAKEQNKQTKIQNKQQESIQDQKSKLQQQNKQAKKQNQQLNDHNKNHKTKDKQPIIKSTNQTQWKKNPTGEPHTTIAHRGASGYAPEHTFNSYDKSHRELGASYIEIDLQRTKDGHLVAMHDETVDRTTNGHGRVEDYTLAELKKLDAGSWFNKQHPNLAKSEYKNAKVPTLDEILNRYGKNANYYIETKSPNVYPGMENQLIQSLNKHGMLTNQSLKHGHVIVQSFSEPSLQKMKQLNPNIPLIRLLDKGELKSQSEADLKHIKSYADGVGPEYTDLNGSNTKHLKDLGFLIHPFTVNKEIDMQRLNDYGVDGVFTNYADKYKNVSHE